MSGSKVAAFRVMDDAVAQLDKAVELLRAVTADTEPVPHQAVILWNPGSLEHHRAFRVQGMSGYWTREECRKSAAKSLELVSDLSRIKSDEELCGHCFGPVDVKDDTPDVETDEVPG